MYMSCRSFCSDSVYYLFCNGRYAGYIYGNLIFFCSTFRISMEEFGEKKNCLLNNSRGSLKCVSTAQNYWHYQRGTLKLKIEQRPGARFAPGPACVCWSKLLSLTSSGQNNLLLIPFCLFPVHFRIIAVFRHQLLIGTILDNTSISENKNPVHNGGNSKPV